LICISFSELDLPLAFIYLSDARRLFRQRVAHCLNQNFQYYRILGKPSGIADYTHLRDKWGMDNILTNVSSIETNAINSWFSLFIAVTFKWRIGMQISASALAVYFSCLHGLKPSISRGFNPSLESDGNE